ncbi:MTRF1L release factor glutamine methyltransferase isoform X2 [Mobula hypostoma]|uniref:MTRF1L release factor glutamine methyltransferase isoform X2 n=1 Tax=Mobula hypostoma TaxID=723540 RepID=UPI002FC39979
MFRMRSSYIGWKVLTGHHLCLASRTRVWSLHPGQSDHVSCFSAAFSRSCCSSVPATGADCVTYWQQIFEQRAISEPLLSAEHIVSHVLGGKTIHSLGAEALTNPLTAELKQTIWDLCSKRLQHMPVQYVIEEWDFCGLTLKVKPPVFIPRPETECLVDLVLLELATKEKVDWQSLSQASSPIFLEIGCGSGAITLSLLHFFKQGFAVAVDKSPEAVSLTRENAERLCLHHRLQELQLNILSDAPELARICKAVDVIVSNPPYIFHEDMPGLMPEILRYEDHDALDGGVDGMKVIKPILLVASKVLKEYGKVFLEVDPRHPVMIENWLQECPRLQLSYLATHQDLYGKPRFCVLQKKLIH